MKIFVGNLSHDVGDEDLLKAFESFGKVESAVVVKDKFTGESRGFGFVEMSSASEAQSAINGMNGDGKGEAVKRDMDPPPADWTKKSDLANVPDGRMFWVTLNGSEGTDMKGFKQGLAKKGKEITEEQAWMLVHYIRTFGK